MGATIIIRPVSPGSSRFGFYTTDGRRDGTAEGPRDFMADVARASGFSPIVMDPRGRRG